jgi:glutaredoxin
MNVLSHEYNVKHIHVVKWETLSVEDQMQIQVKYGTGDKITFPQVFIGSEWIPGGYSNLISSSKEVSAKLAVCM